jgi:hypothetical protein
VPSLWGQRLGPTFKGRLFHEESLHTGHSTLKNGTTMLCRNIGHKLPSDDKHYSKKRKERKKEKEEESS